MHRLAQLRAQRLELEQEQESLTCLISDLNDVWLQIIIDNGEDCKKALAAKYEALCAKEESLRGAAKARSARGQHLNAMAAFWSLVVDEETTEGGKAMKSNMAGTIEIQKAKSQLLLLQGLSMTTSSTKCTSSDH